MHSKHHPGALCCRSWSRKRTFRRHPPSTASSSILHVRSDLVMFFASGLLALLPSLSHTVKSSPTAYGLLMGSFGFGAVVGALLMQRARARWATEVVVTGGVALFGIATLAASVLRSLAGLSAAMIVAGSSWIVFLSLFSVVVLTQAPEWVRARVLALSTLAFQGAVAAGSAVWGTFAQRSGVGTALLYAGAGTLT